MGLLDALQFGGSGGGLLDFLRNQQFSGLPSDQAQYGQPQSMNAMAQMQPNPGMMQAPQQQQPMPVQPPQMPQQQTLPTFMGGQPEGAGFGDRINAGAQNFANAGGLLPALVGGVSGLLTGQRTDPQGMQQQNLRAQYQAFVGAGLSPQNAMLAVMNPEAGKTLINEALTNKEKFQKVGQNGLGQEQYGFVNEREQTVNGKPLSQSSSQDASGLGDMNLKGDAYLASMPKQQASTVQMMVEGKMPPPTSFAMSKPYWQGMIAAAKNYDPNFDETVWAARNNMQKSAQGDGKIGQNNNKLNTGIGHLTQLSDAVDALKNSPYSQTYNAVKNAVGTEFGSTARTNFDSIVNRVAPEIVGIWRNAGGAEADIKRDIDSLKSSHTPEQLHGAILNIAGLMRSKIESNNYEYKSTMGYEPRQPFIRPDAEAALHKLETRAGGQASAPATKSTLPAGWSVQVR